MAGAVAERHDGAAQWGRRQSAIVTAVVQDPAMSSALAAEGLSQSACIHVSPSLGCSNPGRDDRAVGKQHPERRADGVLHPSRARSTADLATVSARMEAPTVQTHTVYVEVSPSTEEAAEFATGRRRAPTPKEMANQPDLIPPLLLYGEALCWVGMALLLAMFCSQLAVVFDLVGSTCGKCARPCTSQPARGPHSTHV